MSSVERRVPRKKVNRPVGILKRGQYSVERMLQVGEGGLMVSGLSDLEVGDRILMTFSLRGEGFFTSRGTVRYQLDETAKKMYGVEFDELPFQVLREIRSFVASSNTKSQAA